MVIRDGDSRRDRDEETEERDDAVIGKAFWRSLALIVAVGVIGAVVGGLGAALGRGTVIPFGPYLALGAVVSLFLREPILTLVFSTWPEWQRRNPSSQWLLLAFASGSLLLLFFVVRRGRRPS